MSRVIAIGCVLFGLASGSAHAITLTAEARSIAGTSWRADGVSVTVAPRSELLVRVAAITVAGRTAARNLQVRCDRFSNGGQANCEKAWVNAQLPGLGTLQGPAQIRYESSQRWRAHVQVPRMNIDLQVDQRGDRLKLALRADDQPVENLIKLVAAAGLRVPGEWSGRLDLSLDAERVGARTTVSAEITAKHLDYGEPSGRYAAEKLAAHATLHWDAVANRLDLALDTRGGQAYLDPLYFNFDDLSMRATGAIIRATTGWRINHLHAAQGDAGTFELSGLLGADLKPVELDATVNAGKLAPLVATDVLPFLIGSPLDALRATGAAVASLSIRESALRSLSVRLSGVSVDAEKIGVSLDGLSGQLAWDAAAKQASHLQWRGGVVKRVPIDASDIRFSLQGRQFTLDDRWRQPLLGGALTVDQLALRDIGTPEVSADFSGAVEPIDLSALCRALGWPEFGGTLGGQLPGVRVRGEIWDFDGALEAQAFDGNIRVTKLRAIQPLGLLSRIMADVEIRRFDLERLTRAFSFGRITGRLDGDIAGLRLLGWSPSAFDARLYSTPGYRGSRRISQRAIDNISSIGGGPTGMLSRGFFSLFQDFAYDRLGISCVLRNGVCEMSGVAPATSEDGQQAYYLVRGRLLPRIDVVGHAQRVSWSNLIGQLKAVQASGGPEIEK